MNHKFETEMIHAGTPIAGDEGKALNPPIHMSSTFTFDDIDDAERVMSFESADYVYTRGNNPTLRLFESRMAILEEGSAAVAFASGMAAISSVLFSLTAPGDTVICHTTLYGSSHSVMTRLLPKYGVRSLAVDLTVPDNLKRALAETRLAGGHGAVPLIFFETPANPDLGIVDITAVSEIAHTFGCIVVVDNTFASPYLQRPLVLGADVVVHSATKYLCGHGDALGGVAVCKDADYAHKLKFEYMCEFGGVMSPFNAWLMIRGMKTLSLRMERHCSNASAIAQALEGHPAVAHVLYPGLRSHPQSALAKTQMAAPGGIISLDLVGGAQEAKRFCDGLRLIRIAVSLGDCETLIQLPSLMTHRGYSEAELERFGLTPSMLRISAGLEHPDDIIQDILQALDRV